MGVMGMSMLIGFALMMGAIFGFAAIIVVIFREEF
jgi:hypothetical protein